METEERRRYLRSQAGKRVTGRLSANHEAAILDISRGGALIEHINRVRPGALSFLTIFLDGREISATCRVIRSAICRYEVRPTGERGYVYRTGLEFSALSEESQRVLDAGLEALEKMKIPSTA